MAEQGDLSRTELASEVADIVAPCLPEPFGTMLTLVTKIPALYGRVAKARTESWWQEFLAESARRRGVTPSAMLRELEGRADEDPAIREVVFEHVRQMMNAVFEGCVPILGALSGAYYAEGNRPDAFFRSLVGLLLQCSESDLGSVRSFVGRLACVKPEATGGTLQLETIFRNRDAWEHRIAHIDLEAAGVKVHSILGAEWPADAQWRRGVHLLVSAGFAQSDGLSKIIIRHDDMLRMQTFLKTHAGGSGRYRYAVRGTSGSFTAELELVPHCFGYGTTEEVAAEVMRRNIVMFVGAVAAEQFDRV